MKIGKVKILNLEIVLDGLRDKDEYVDLGALTLKRDGRECILDITQSETTDETDETNISCDLEVDKDTFAECKYDLTDTDLMSYDLTAEVYIGGTFSNEIKHITLFVKYDGGLVKAINVEQE